MALPTELLSSVSSLGGGKIALVVGAGCSVEAPTSLPLARECSEELHRRLLADGVLQPGDCLDPTDLSLVADAVFTRKNSQRDVVEYLRDQYDLSFALPNNGYLIAAAMLCEGVLSSVVTLNFDLALSHALSELGVGQIVGVIERPADLVRQKAINVYYLHGNANAEDPESWVLRTQAIREEWKEHWEPIVTLKVLTAPAVVFAGLGTPVAVLVASIRLLRNALTASTRIYQVDPGNKTESSFFQELALDPAAYIQSGWCQFMDELSERLLVEHIVQFERAIARKTTEDGLREENVTALVARLKAFGLVTVGKLRAQWLLHDRPYHPAGSDAHSLIADLVLALAMIGRLAGAAPVILEDGLVEFHRGGRAVVAYLVASGRGHRGRTAVEAAVEVYAARYRTRPVQPRGVIVGGTSDAWTAELTPPSDVVRGDVFEDIIASPSPLSMFHISEIRSNQNLIQQMVP